MDRWIRRVTVGLLMGMSLASGAAAAAELPGVVKMSEVDQFAGQPVDIAPWAYVWRADLPVQGKAEAYFIPRRLERIDKIYRTAAAALPPDQLKSIYYDMPDLLKPLPPAPKGKLLAGLLWTGGVSKYQVALHWPDAAKIPSPDAVEVRVYPTSFGWFGWTVDQVPGRPEVSADGRIWTYKPDPAAKMDSSYSQRVPAATEMVAVFGDAQSAVPTIAVSGESIGSWKRIDIRVEGEELLDQVELYMAVAGPIAPLSKGHHGFTIPLLYAPDARPGLDSRMTLTRKSGPFTVRVRDLENEHVFIPSQGVMVSNTALPYIDAPPRKSIRQMTREHPEAKSWDELMQNVRLWSCPPGTVAPPMPQVPAETVVLRFRHPQSTPIKSVTVDGKPWNDFNKDKETITLKGLIGAVTVTASY